jgi:hypothetical protein
MRIPCLAFLLLASFAHGQAASPVSPPATGEVPEMQVKVGPEDAVITVNGFCTTPAQPGTDCRTVITRAQFEKLAEALQPGMSLSLRLNVANAYARNLRMSAAAERRGLDKTPAFEEEMRYARMQLLSQDLTRALQAEANHVTDADVEDYYKKNESAFEQATMARIFVPRAKQREPAGEEEGEAQSKADEEEMMKVANDLRGRAGRGEDPDQLQIEAYTAAGFPQTTPSTKMEKVRRATLPTQHETVMNLKPGEISEVFSDPAGAHFIYKMISKQTLTLEDVKAEIRSIISSQRYRDSMKGFQGDVVFNDAYFNPRGTVATPPQRIRKGKRKNLTAQPDRDHD